MELDQKVAIQCWQVSDAVWHVDLVYGKDRLTVGLFNNSEIARWKVKSLLDAYRAILDNVSDFGVNDDRDT